MTDYGHDLLFGTMVLATAERVQHALDLAELADTLGLDLVSFADHPYQPAQLDVLTLLSVVAARTSTVRILPNVANLAMRSPAMLARSAASLDILSDGRFELGLGTGALWDDIAAFGGPRRTPGESIKALAEAVHLIRGQWTSGDAVHFDGEYYRLDGAAPGPFPRHDIGIWLGAYQPRLLRLLRLTGRIGDGWLPSSPYLPPEHLAGANQLIDEAAERPHGRRPRSAGSITSPESSRRQRAVSLRGRRSCGCSSSWS
jgi:alkanesulfonate monooxygenase SsuD/methylene tetrahydromethanopterin reductase-like flavin-dependent oxidoreductase (luciferase family)